MLMLMAKRKQKRPENADRRDDADHDSYIWKVFAATSWLCAIQVEDTNAHHCIFHVHRALLPSNIDRSHKSHLQAHLKLRS